MSLKAWDIMLAAADRLEGAAIASAREEAELLLTDLTGWDRSALYVDRTKTLSSDQEKHYEDWVSRRALGEPHAYIVGYRDFYKHRFTVTADTLIPRGDSETLIEAVLAQVGQDQTHKILDLGTGSGCLLLSLLYEMPNSTGLGVDFNPAALDVAAENAKIVECAGRVQWLESNWFDAVPQEGEPFSILLSNPPYIPSAHIDGLDVGVKAFEPSLALDGGGSGLKCYAKILDAMHSYVAPDSLIIFEVGIGQAEDVGKMMKDHGLKNIKTFKDLGHIDRVVSAIYT